MLWYIGKSCKMEPTAVDITNYEYTIDQLACLIAQEIDKLSNEEIKKMQMVLSQWLKLEETTSTPQKQEIYQTLSSLEGDAHVEFIYSWVTSILDKYPPEVARIIFGILRHNIDKDIYLGQSPNLTMKLSVINGDDQRQISVPAQIVPNTIYNVLVTYCQRMKHSLEQYSWQHPKQLQVAILTMIQFCNIYCMFIRIKINGIM